MTSIPEIVKQIHQNAVEKGWWDKERSLAETLTLLHSEASEAVEDYRNGKGYNVVWYEDGVKPCGIPTELADILIRIFDFCGRYDLGERLEDEVIRLKGHIMAMGINPDKTFMENMAVLHWLISSAGGFVPNAVGLAYVVRAVYLIAEIYEISVDKTVNIKAQYNATRPYRHGGKKA